jgi:hypothetical protein
MVLRLATEAAPPAGCRRLMLVPAGGARSVWEAGTAMLQHWAGARWPVLLRDQDGVLRLARVTARIAHDPMWRGR